MANLIVVVAVAPQHCYDRFYTYSTLFAPFVNIRLRRIRCFRINERSHQWFSHGTLEIALVNLTRRETKLVLGLDADFSGMLASLSAVASAPTDQFHSFPHVFAASIYSLGKRREIWICRLCPQSFPRNTPLTRQYQKGKERKSTGSRFLERAIHFTPCSPLLGTLCLHNIRGSQLVVQSGRV